MSLRLHPAHLRSAALPTLAVGALLLAGCGSQAKTASVSSAPPPQTTSASTSSTSPSTTSTTTSSVSATGTVEGNGGTPASGNGQSSGSAPAFVQQESAEGSLKSALAVLRAHGYSATETSAYHPAQTLRVLVGTRTGSADGDTQQAFFFVDSKYIGTDSNSPSAGVKVVSQSDTGVTLAYRLYRPGEPLCCGTGGEADVRFELNDGKLVPLDPIPPVESKTGTSRQ